jgi:hypothetical protein
MADMLDTLPTVPLSDLKVGDTIVVSSTKGADPSRLTAISLVTGADTLLNLLAVRQQGAPGGGGQRPQGGGGADLSGLGLFGGMGMP